MGDRMAKVAVARPVRIGEGEQEFTEAKGFVLETEVVYREKVKVPFDEGEQRTIGDMIDMQIADLAKNDGEMRRFSISFDDASWNDAKEAYKGYEAPNRTRY